MALDAAAVAALALAFAAAHGSGTASAAETQLATDIQTFVLKAVGVPNTGATPLIDSVAGPVTGTVDIT